MAYRQRIVNIQTMTKNSLHSVLHGHHIEPVAGDLFAAKNRSWWLALSVSATQQLRIRHNLDTLQHLQTQLTDIEAEISRLSTSVSPWKELAPYPIQLPGFGMITSMTVLAAIGDITHFPSSKELVGYSGLGAGVHDSGETHRDKGVTKQGRRDLRKALIESATRQFICYHLMRLQLGYDLPLPALDWATAFGKSLCL